MLKTARPQILFLTMLGSLAVGVGGVSGPPAVAAAASDANDPSCRLVPKAEAEALLGEALDDLSIGAGGMCSYQRKADHKLLIAIKLYPKLSRNSFETQAEAAATMMKVSLRPVDGLGEEAFALADYQLAIYQHGNAISVSHAGSKLSATKVEAFTRKALTRL